MKTDPYFFQKLGIYRMVHRYKGRVLLADDVGLGKSLQSLYAAKYFKHERPIIIVCPNAVKYSWEAEVRKHTRWRSIVLEGTKPQTQQPLHPPDVVILNWDILKFWTPFLKQLKPNIIIGDESQYIKSMKAQRTEHFMDLCTDMPYVFLLSGTPVENRPVEFYTSLRILKPKLFPSFWKFGNRYCGRKVTPWGVKYDGASNTKELNALLRKHVMIRRTKQQVLKDLPPIQRTVVPLSINRKEYHAAESDFFTWLAKNKPSKVRRLANSTAIHLAKLSYLLGLVAELKTKAVCEWIDNFLETTNKKLVVFGHHREFLESLYGKYQKQAVLVYGGIDAKKRQTRIDNFVEKKKTRLFFGSIMAMGTGVNKLQTVCSDVAIVELIWVGVKILQAEGRLHRIGQNNHVNSYYLIAKDTVEASLCNAITKKQASINEIMDGKEDGQEFDILKTVITDYKRRKKR